MMVERVEEALDVILRYGGEDEAHHKQWVLDQVVRILTNCPTVQQTGLSAGGTTYTYDTLSESPEYLEWVRHRKAGENGPDTYEWDEGIAP